MLRHTSTSARARGRAVVRSAVGGRAHALAPTPTLSQTLSHTQTNPRASPECETDDEAEHSGACPGFFHPHRPGARHARHVPFERGARASTCLCASQRPNDGPIPHDERLNSSSCDEINRVRGHRMAAARRERGRSSTRGQGCSGEDAVRQHMCAVREGYSAVRPLGHVHHT
eukprot:5260772-Pleurochrysis_carterae.AAC.3